MATNKTTKTKTVKASNIERQINYFDLPFAFTKGYDANQFFHKVTPLAKT